MVIKKAINLFNVRAEKTTMSAAQKTRHILSILSLMLILNIGVAQARVEGYPYIDNELIGTFNLVRHASIGPVEEFEFIYWAQEVLDSFASSGDAMGPLRYVIAFSSYAVAQTASYTPAYREPYREVMEALIRKMLYYASWKDWLESWGDNPLGPDNIMYTGHLVYMMTFHRQLFNDQTFEQSVTLVNPEGPEFTTDVQSLAASIAQQVEDYVDAGDAHTYGIACEPGRIFVPCNLPHSVGQMTFDRIYGTTYTSTNDLWLDWLKEHMVHPEHGVLYDLYYPFGPGQSVAGESSPSHKEGLSGLYNGWSIWLLHALDKAWAEELYEHYKAYFVVRGENSPQDDGRTMVIDSSNLTGLAKTAMDTIATGFGMVAAKQFADESFYQELEKTWALIFSEPAWSEDGLEYVHTAPLFPLIFQNGFPLLARSISSEVNVSTLAQKVWDPSFFEQPFVSNIEPSEVFVNQAIYDEDKGQLLITLNTGQATSQAVTLSIENLEKDADYWVRRDGQTYRQWKWEGQHMLLETATLSANEETYTIEKGKAPGFGCACSVSSFCRGCGFLWFGLCFCMGWRLMRRKR